MTANDAPQIDFSAWDGDTIGQRDAALNILKALKKFFGTEDLTEINDKITDERLSKTNGLTKAELQKYVSSFRDLADELDFIQNGASRSADELHRQLNNLE